MLELNTSTLRSPATATAAHHGPMSTLTLLVREAWIY